MMLKLQAVMSSPERLLHFFGLHITVWRLVYDMLVTDQNT